jgi:hypothetical protein
MKPVIATLFRWSVLATLFLMSGAWIHGVPSSGFPPPYVTLNAGFSRLQTALQNPAGQYLVCGGESTFAGYGTFFNASLFGSDERSGTACAQIAFQFRKLGYNVRTNNLAGNANVQTSGQTGAQAAATYATYDRRVNPGTWAVGTGAPNGCAFNLTSAGGGGPSGPGPGGCPWISTDNSSPFTFTPQDTTWYPSNTGNAASGGTDTLEVWYLSSNGFFAGTLSINNGGSTCGTINTALGTTLTLQKATITCASPGTAWRITAIVGVTYLQMLNAKLSTAPEISLFNVSFVGATTYLFLNTAPSGTGTIASMIASLNPVGAFFQLGGNDISNSGSISTSQTQTNMSSIISALTPTADFMMVTTNPQQPAASVGSGKSPYDTQQSYVTALVGAANANNAAFFDWFKYQCGTITGSGGSAVASKGCWADQGTGWNAQNATNAADPDHQSIAAYSTEASTIVSAARPQVAIN